MSLSRKSDVKNHLSRRIPPLKPVTEPDATGYSGDESLNEKRQPTNSDSDWYRNPSSVRNHSAVLPHDAASVAEPAARKLQA
jgi:hypothetical protein